MADVAGTTGAQTPARGQIVVPAQDLAAVQTPDGELVPVDRLGPGLVERLEDDGVWVYWLGAGSSTTRKSRSRPSASRM